MEHRLLLGGGEHLLPFARSCITKLKKLGLPYANQSFEIDGVSVKVRVEPGHEYIRIEGGGVLGWRLLPADRASPYGYVVHPDSPLPDGTFRQVPYLADELGEPGEDEDVSKTRNPYVYITPAGSIREETTVIDGDYLWTDGKNERLLLGGGAAFIYKQKMFFLADLWVTGGAVIEVKIDDATKKFVILAGMVGTLTVFFSVPMSEVLNAKTGHVVKHAVLIGSGPVSVDALKWRFSPDGASAIAVENLPIEPGDKNNKFSRSQILHRASINVVDGDLTVVFSAETKAGAILKCVPTQTFKCVEMTRYYTEYPAYVHSFSRTIVYESWMTYLPGIFNAASFPFTRADSLDPRLAGPYPTATSQTELELPPVVAGGWPDRLFSVYDTSKSPEAHFATGTVYTNADSLGQLYYRTLCDTTNINYADDDAVRLRRVDSSTDALSAEQAVADVSNTAAGYDIDHVKSLFPGFSRNSSGMSVSPSSRADAANYGVAWTMDSDSVVFLSGGGTGVSIRASEIRHLPDVNVFSAYMRKVKIRYKFPFDHRVATHWERRTTFHYEGREIIGADYTNDGKETLLELVGRSAEKVTYLCTDKSIPLPPPPDDKSEDTGFLKYEYEASGSCGYSLMCNGDEVATHKVEVTASRNEEYTYPVSGGNFSYIFRNPQTVRERAFTVEGFDLRNGLVLTQETVMDYSDNGVTQEHGVAKANGTLKGTGAVMMHSPLGVEKLLDHDVVDAVLTDNYHRPGLANSMFMTSIITGSRRLMKAQEPVSISGVLFTNADFYESPPSEFGAYPELARVKFQSLLPEENRDISGKMGSYYLRSSSAWYRFDQSATGPMSVADARDARAWFYTEVAVGTPGPQAVANDAFQPDSLTGAYDLRALSSKTWLVRGRYPDKDGEVAPEVVIIRNKGKKKLLMLDYIDKDTATFGTIGFVA